MEAVRLSLSFLHAVELPDPGQQIWDKESAYVGLKLSIHAVKLYYRDKRENNFGFRNAGNPEQLHQAAKRESKI